MNREARIERLLTGVLRQACADAGVQGLRVAGAGAAADLARSICEQAVGAANLGNGLLVDPASKTALLLGECPPADVLLFGDLYYSQVAELAGSAELPAASARLAELCGGGDVLDRVLCRFFDERAPWQSAAAELVPGVRELLEQALERARFRRARVGLVPKLGGRTLGIDLYA